MAHPRNRSSVRLCFCAAVVAAVAGCSGDPDPTAQPGAGGSDSTEVGLPEEVGTGASALGRDDAAWGPVAVPSDQVVLAATFEEADALQAERLPGDEPSALDEADETSGVGDPLPARSIGAAEARACANAELVEFRSEIGRPGAAEAANELSSIEVKEGSRLADSLEALSSPPVESELDDLLKACEELGYER